MSRLALAMVVALALPSLARAAPAPFPPGLEADVQGLVTDAHLSGGCEIGSIRIEAFFIDLHLACGKDTSVLRLTGHEDGTAGFVLHLPEGAPAVVSRAAKELAAIIEKKDARSILARTVQLEASQPLSRITETARPLGLLDNLRRALVWAALIVLLGWLGAAGARRASGVWLACLALVFLGALVVRWRLGPWAPFHGNEHGISELRGLVASSSQWQGPIETDRYGVAYRQIAQVFAAFFSSHLRGVFILSMLASALSVIPLALLGAALTGSRPVGAVAAVGLAAHPIHIALAGTESAFVLAGLLFLLGAASLCSLSTVEDRHRRAAIWLGALALTASAELAVNTLAFPVAGLLLALTCFRRQDARLWFLPLIVLGGSMLLHLYSLWPVLQAARANRENDFADNLRSFVSARNALTTSTLTSPLLLPLSIAGALVLLVRKPRVGIALIASALVLLAAASLVSGCRKDMIRYQGNGHLLLFIAAGSLLMPLRHRVVVGVASIALLAALLFPTRTAFAALRAPLLDVSAYRLVEQAEAKLPKDVTVFIAPRRITPEILSDFPEYVLQERGHTVQVEAMRDGPSDSRGDCAVWLSPACYSFTQAEVSAGVMSSATKISKASVRSECAPLIRKIDSAAEPYVAAALPVPFREDEFFRLSGQPLIGLFRCRQ
jgi:hypothetical protein